MANKEYVGLDVGKARVGFARGSETARIAEPLYSVPTEQALDKLKSLDADGVVVGLPRNLDGRETAQTSWVRQWVDHAKTALSTTFYMQDEALTTVEAQKQTIKDAKADIDAVAAALI